MKLTSMMRAPFGVIVAPWVSVTRIALVVGGMTLASQAAFAQTTRDETFDAIGRTLGTIQQGLSGQPRAESFTTTMGGATTSSAVTFPRSTTTTKDVELYTLPVAGGASTIKMEANSPVRILGTDKDFAVVVPEGVDWKGAPLYAKASDLGLTGYVGNRLSEAMQQLKALAAQMETNPYVRLKGFSIAVSASPSLNVDFEMKQGGALTPSTTQPGAPR